MKTLDPGLHQQIPHVVNPIPYLISVSVGKADLYTQSSLWYAVARYGIGNYFVAQGVGSDADPRTASDAAQAIAQATWETAFATQT